MTSVVRRIIVNLRFTCQEQILAKNSHGIKEQRLRVVSTHCVRIVIHLASAIDNCSKLAIIHLSMANYIAIAIILGIICGQALSMVENVDRNLLGLNLPYGRGLDSELQLTRLMLATPRFCHPKRNSELINSLLGLPKNMHNAGK